MSHYVTYIKISIYNTLVQQYYRIYDSMWYAPMYPHQFMIQKGMHIYNTVKCIHICKWKQKKEMEIKIPLTDHGIYIYYTYAIISIEYPLHVFMN